METCHIERPQQPTVLRWHPTKPVLALGWENGEVVLLTHPSGDQTVLPNTHAACITLLEWSSSGSRLVSGDQVSVFQWQYTQACCHTYAPYVSFTNWWIDSMSHSQQDLNFPSLCVACNHLLTEWSSSSMESRCQRETCRKLSSEA